MAAVSALDNGAALEINALRDLRKTGLHPDFWYPVARSRDLKSDRPLPVTFAGQPIVLVRPASGDVFALENRCAHRQVPLHLGVIRNERLLCSYHCWAYDKTGKCVNVPYMPEGTPLPAGVRSYPVREAYGLVFVFPGSLAAAARVPFPDVPTFARRDYKTRYLDRRINCHYTFMHENLMDMNHQFLHRRLMGSIRAKPLDLRAGENWVEVDYTFSRTAGKQSFGEKFMLGENRVFAKRVQQPSDRDHDLMTIRTGYPYQTLQFWPAGDVEPALDLWNIYVPVDSEQRINQTYGLMMIKKPGIPGLINVLWPFIVWFTNGILGQDQEIVEEEQRAWEAQRGDRNQEVFPIIQKLRTLLRDKGVPIS
jgi:phenylpropionate dioxygenase-like ring-hydroxylating dioxygenase large terminal subunit